MTTFSDIFRQSFLDGYSGIGIRSSLAALAVSCLFGLYIFAVYRVVTRKTFYSKTFNITLPCLVVITAAVILTIQSSIVVSLGMVGALSIVRFRTAIKDPMDLMFLFWAISAGIICGAGIAVIALLLSAILTIGILVLDMLPVAKAPMILVVNASVLDAEEAVLKAAEQHAQHLKVKSRNLTASSADYVIELRTEQGGELVRGVMAVPGVTSASLLSHDGEVTF